MNDLDVMKFPLYTPCSNHFLSMTEQEINSVLRQRYLKALHLAHNKPAEVQCYENTGLSGRFQVIAPSGDYLVLSDVQTPSGHVQHVAIRASDVLTMTVDLAS